MLQLVFLLLLSVAAGASKPHLLLVLQDDMGWYDCGFLNPNAESYTRNITALAEHGVVLSHHYTHWHCSPTRRTILSGRLPLHHGEQLSDLNGDDLDLRWNLLPAKMKQAGYTTYWYGKAHTGFRSMAHLPKARGFDHYFGYLTGAQSYTSDQRWENAHPVHTQQQFENPCDGCEYDTYGTQLYGELAVRAVEQHNASVPMFMYYAHQAMHTPYDKVPGNPFGNSDVQDIYKGMLWDADVYIGKFVQTLKDKGMWDNTLLVYFSDNGGVNSGNNYPLRGEKHTNWEGGMRVAALVSGGFLPKSVRGTQNNITFHAVDWYATFSSLAGVSPADGPSIPPLPTDPESPFKNIYGNDSYPAIDSVNIWDMIVNPSSYDISSAHPFLVLSKEVAIQGQYKLLVSQPYFKTQNNGWKQPNGTWEPSNNADWPCNYQDLPPQKGFFPGSGHGVCLFDLRADPSERKNIAAQHADVVQSMWHHLNMTVLTVRDCQGFTGPVPGPDGHCSPPELQGNCNTNCSANYWQNGWPDPKSGSVGPICGVPGC